MRKVLYILGQLSDQDADWLASVGRRQRIAAGTVLIELGKPLDDVFIVLDGELSVLAPNGREIASVGSGDVLGEMSFVDDSPPSASVKASSDARVLAVAREEVKRKLAGDTGFAARFYKAIAIFLAERMRSTLSGFGYGGGYQPAYDVDELDSNVLDNVHLAGSRFERMLKKLAG